MANVVGPLLSLSASGNFAKTLNFYWGKEGPVARRVKKTWKPPGEIWYVNVDWFRAASDRYKSFSIFQKNAWTLYFLGLCDTARCKFMGLQISLWNQSYLNDLSWPPFSHNIIKWNDAQYYENNETESIFISLSYKQYDMKNNEICGIRWYNSSSSSFCDESFFLRATTLPYTNFSKSEIKYSYWWVKPYRFDGSLDPFHLVLFMRH